MNVLIINQPLGNRGDEAAHRALVREINKRCPNAVVKIFSCNGDQNILDEIGVKARQNEYINPKACYKLYSLAITTLNEHPNLYPLVMCQPILNKTRRWIRWADVVVCAPGGICMGGFMNWSHISNLFIALRENKKIVYFCRSIGPFSEENPKKKLFKDVSIKLLHSFDYISLRDKKSQELADSLGVKYHSTTDAAFLDNTEVNIPAEIKKQIGDKHYIVFVPNSLKWHYYFKNTDAGLIKRFYLGIVKTIEEKLPDCNIVFLPQTFRNPTGNDVEYFRELKRDYKSERMIVIDDIYGSDIQQSVIRGAKFVIGARYHSVVFSINQQVPFCALSYEHKIEGLLQLLGATHHMIDIKDIFGSEQSIEKALQQVVSIIDDIMSGNNRCGELCANAKNIAHEEFSPIAEIING